jgi:glycerol-3-phosphate acyltransferase PlsY
MLPQLLWAVLAFFLGALPLSVWVGRLAARRDIREVADHNPGATNVLRTGGFGWFIVAMSLDISKAAAPVGLATHIFGWDGWPLLLIALAPPLGHAFSPFLGGKGGKAVAAVFGVWIGLTIWQVPVVCLAALAFWFLWLRTSGWVVVLTMTTVLGALLLWRPEPLLMAVAAAQIALLAYTHRADLSRRPVLRFPRPKKG